MCKVKIHWLEHGLGLDMDYKSERAAGLDLAAAIDPETPLEIAPGERALVPTGFAMELPPDHEAQIRPRSGLALEHGVGILNSPGTIDADYRGEIKILLINLGNEAFLVKRGMRIAQMVIAPVARAQLVRVEKLEGTRRGTGGFGSTGHQ